MILKSMTRFATALLGVAVIGAVVPAQAAMFVAGADPTTTFSDLLLDDVTAGTGQDSATVTSIAPGRNLDVPTGLGPVDISITGIGLNFRPPTSTTEETITVTVTYFGADNTFNTADDLLLGSETASMRFLGTVDQYSAVFDNPITGQIDGVEDRFRIAIGSTGSMRFKTWNTSQSPSGEGGLKLSVGGTATLAVPEPSSLIIASLFAVLACLRTRR